MHASALDLTMISRTMPSFKILERARPAWYLRLSNGHAYRVPAASR